MGLQTMGLNMFNDAQINEYKDLAAKLYPLQQKLEFYCDQVAKELDFNSSVISYMSHDGHVHFKAEWFGPYQSHNTEWFTFPAQHLLQSPVGTARFIKGWDGEKD